MGVKNLILKIKFAMLDALFPSMLVSTMHNFCLDRYRKYGEDSIQGNIFSTTTAENGIWKDLRSKMRLLGKMFSKYKMFKKEKKRPPPHKTMAVLTIAYMAVTTKTISLPYYHYLLITSKILYQLHS